MTDGIEPDERLASAARAGDRRAFEVLIGVHKERLYRFIRRYIGNADDSYDVLQETFISAWLSLGRYEVDRSFSVWLRAIALNKCRDHGRRGSVRRRLLQLLAGQSASSQRSEEELESEIELLQSRRLQRLDRAIAALPRRYKEPLLLTLVSGLTQQQAALELATSTKAIEMRIRRAKSLLRDELAEVAPRGDPVEER